MEYPSHIKFEQLDEVTYQVTDSKENRYFVGELDETLDFYSAWVKGDEPYEDIEYFIELDGIEFECDIDLDDED